jgi:hypothetical protein
MIKRREYATAVTDRSVWACVVQRALDDLAAVSPLGMSGLDQGQAESFLTDESGEWAVSREIICDAAGVLPDAVRAYARRLLAINARRLSLGLPVFELKQGKRA